MRSPAIMPAVIKPEIRRLTDGTYIELVGSLYRTMIPTLVMVLSFVAIAIWLVADRRDMGLLVAALFGAIAALGRLIVLLVHRSEALRLRFDATRAGILERRFALPYHLFALGFGAFAARGLHIATADQKLLIVGLLFGYGAGVAAGIALRPWIGIPSMAIAILPSIMTCLLLPGAAHKALSVLTAVFLAGGINSMLRRYRDSSAQITAQRLLVSIDRQDDLTGLPNRIALRANFEHLVATGASTAMAAIHHVGLLGMERINSVHGHHIGDAAIRAASERLAAMAPRNGIQARLAGLEFAVVQPMIDHPQQAEALARDLQTALAKPYRIGTIDITIGCAVGYAYARENGADLDVMMRGAQSAFSRAPHEPLKVARYSDARWRAA